MPIHPEADKMQGEGSSRIRSRELEETSYFTLVQRSRLSQPQIACQMVPDLSTYPKNTPYNEGLYKALEVQSGVSSSLIHNSR